MKSKIVAGTLALLTLIPAGVVIAQEQEVEQTQNACETVEEAIDSTLTYFKSQYLDHNNTYQSLLLNLSTLNSKAEVLGYDTEELTDNLIELETLIESFTENFDTFEQQMTRTRNLACSQNETLYIRQLDQAKDSLLEVRTSAEDISAFFEDTVKETVINLELIEE